MSSDDKAPRPEVGSWYEDRRQRQFEVVAYDEDAQLIEIQYFDGNIGELDLDEWEGRVVLEIAPPEDLSGAYDKVNPDDTSDSGRAMRPEDWDGPWNELEQDG